jgi:hypothetical protein
MKQILVTLALLVVLFSTACAPDEIDRLLSAGDSPEAGSEGEPGVDLLAEGAGPLEITPGPGGSGEGEGGNIDSSSDDSSGNISKSGETAPSGSSGDQSGSLDSSMPGSSSAGKPGEVVAWNTFTENNYKFSIAYPQHFVILPEIDLLKNIDQDLLFRVRFQDKELAEGDTADLEIPQFSVEVYTATTDTLEAFLKQRTPDASYEEFHLGDLVGYKVVLARLIAPNEFYFFLAHGYVYKLTPLGEYGLEMLQTFKILP